MAAPGRREPIIAVVPSEQSTARAWHALGHRYAPLFAAFVRWVASSAAEKGFDRVFYFTREGRFFAAIHQVLLSNDSIAADLPTPVVIEVSRLATFAASLPVISAEHLAALWQKYPRQTPRSALTSLGLETARLPRRCTTFGLNEDELIAADDPRWKALLSDPINARWLEEHRAQQQAALDAYLTARGWPRSLVAAATADIGWHGTIQNHLSRLRTDTRINGFYFGLMPRRKPTYEPPIATAAASSEQLVNKHNGFVNETREVPILPTFDGGITCRRLPRDGGSDGDRRCFVTEYLTAGDRRRAVEFLKFVGPMEMLCNSPGGSVIGYEIGPSGPRAVYRPLVGEEEIYEQATRYFQAGVIEAIAIGCLRSSDTPRKNERRRCRRLLRELMIDPPRLVAAAHDRLHHDESFGCGSEVIMHRWIPPELYWRAIFSAAGRRRLWERLTTVPWPHGYLVARRMRWLCRVLNWKYFRALSTE